MLDFTLEDISAEELQRLRALYEPLADSVRELIDATIRTQVDADAVAAAKAEIDSAKSTVRSGCGISKAASGWPGATPSSESEIRSHLRW